MAADGSLTIAQDRGVKPAFCQTHKQPQGNQLSFVLDESVANGKDAPNDEGCAHVPRCADAASQCGGQRLEGDVGREENTAGIVHYA